MRDSVVLPLLLMMQYAAAEYCAIRRKRERSSGVIPGDSVFTRELPRGRTRARVMLHKEHHRLMISVVKRVYFAIWAARKGEEGSEGLCEKGTTKQREVSGGVVKAARRTIFVSLSKEMISNGKP